MKKRLLALCILIVYIVILIRVMVFKDIPLIRIGSIMLNFGGTDGGHPANFVPFKTIFPYLLGDKGWIIAGTNLAGNILPLVPLGVLIPFVYRNIPWKKSLILAIASALAIEIMQTVLRVGIFDIDDVILNALGVMLGYWTFVILARWIRSRNYKNIIIAAIISIAAAAAFYGVVIYPMSRLPVPTQRGERLTPGVSAGGDLCGGTNGNGEIVSVGKNTFIIKHKDRPRTVHLSDQATIRTSAGSIALSDLKSGYRVTLVGGPNPDGSFTADAVVVCNTKGANLK